MPNEAFACCTRLKAVEREYVVARFAADRLDQQTRDNPEILQGDLRLRENGPRGACFVLTLPFA